MAISLSSPQARTVAQTAPVVFVECESTGKHASGIHIGLHEAVLARQRLESEGESLIVKSDWPEHIPQVQERQVGAEYARLLKEYKKPLMVGTYGEPHTGRLKSVMDKIAKAHEAGYPAAKIIEIGRPESDFIDFAPEPVPSGPLKSDGLAIMSDPKEPVRLAPPEGTEPKSIDDVEDEDPVIDGKLVAFLGELGWNEPTSLAAARLVMANGIDGVTDTHLQTVREFLKPDARKKVRQHLIQYKTAPSVAATA